MGSASSAHLPDIVSKDILQTMAGNQYSEILYRKLRSWDGNIHKSDLISFVESATDVFLTHDWGVDETGRNNHARVSRVNQALQARGLRTWFDEESMKGDIQKLMGDGIDGSSVIVVFITQRYIDKVAGKGEKKDLDSKCRIH